MENRQWEFAVWLRELTPALCDDLEGGMGREVGRDAQEGGDMGMPMADSCWCLAETNPILWSNYPSVKNKFLKMWKKNKLHNNIY